MSLLTNVQDRLRQQVPQLRTVDGLAAYASLPAKPPTAKLPAAYVFALSDSGEPNATASGPHRQRITTVIGVALVVSTLPDARGEAGALALEPLRALVRNALMGWKPAGADTPFDFLAGELLQAKEGTADWQLTLSCRSTVSIL
jgi:hypothetical protein